MINLIQLLPIGNALRVFLTPPDGSIQWRLLRRTDDNFVDENDPGAVLVLDTGTDKVILDVEKLINGTLYYYRAYYYDGNAWTASVSMAAMPDTTYEDHGVDVLTILIDRLTLGLEAEILQQKLFPNSGKIKVFNAPPQFEDTKFPVVTVHIDKDAPGERFVGEVIASDVFSNNVWTEAEGWLARWSLSIIGWAMNPDERIALRKSIKRILLANLPVFDGLDMDLVEFDFSDSEDLTSYPAPIYQVNTQFSCLAPAYVTATTSAITDVQLTVDGEVTNG